MHTILLIGAFESLTFALLLSVFKRNKIAADFILAFFFLLLSLSMFLVWMDHYNRTHQFRFSFLLFTATPLILLHGPVLWLYIRSLTKQHFVLRPMYLLHLVPFMLMVIQHSIEFYSLPAPQKIAIAVHESFMQYPSYPVFLSMIVLSPLLYFAWGLKLIKQHNKQLKNYFSKVNDINLSWLRTLLIVSFLFYLTVNIAFVFFVPRSSFHYLQLTCFTYSTIYVLFLGFYGHRQVNLFATMNPVFELEQIEQSTHCPKRSNADEEFIQKLLELMKTEKPFRNPEITLASLSELTQKSPEYVSSVLNNQLNCNFYDFINNYRIQEFKDICRLPENQKFSIIAIAYNCGFNSKATFYRVFKSATGTTPTEYMNMSHES